MLGRKSEAYLRVCCATQGSTAGAQTLKQWFKHIPQIVFASQPGNLAEEQDGALLYARRARECLIDLGQYRFAITGRDFGIRMDF